ncbi:unnamed protein product [Danaus chrysippus]|uniref:(African queen) hypothetical protein n=1 Tax=Danaus chrysippus TaxID=151541 RepID=A0A8J2WAR2_9NEOP|nr:unnamed protein product [Danaus chrysippus]
MKMCLTLVLCFCFCVFHVTADRIYYPYEYRSAPGDMESKALPFQNSNIQNNMRPPQIIHISQPKPLTDVEKGNAHTNSFTEILHKMDQMPKNEERPQNPRTTSEDLSNRASFEPKTSFEPWIPSFQEKSILLPPVKFDHEGLNPFPPKLDLLAPVAEKVSGKLNGLVELIHAIVGNSNNFLVRGFKQIVIDGIIRPMLLLKGGLKALISKLAIPLISLLLINVEILITVWWLWDDCIVPEPINEPLKFRNAANTTETS